MKPMDWRDHGCTDSDCPCDGRSLIYPGAQRMSLEQATQMRQDAEFACARGLYRAGLPGSQIEELFRAYRDAYAHELAEQIRVELESNDSAEVAANLIDPEAQR